MKPDQLANGRALTRTITPMLLGFAVESGKLALEDPLAQVHHRVARRPARPDHGAPAGAERLGPRGHAEPAGQRRPRQQGPLPRLRRRRGARRDELPGGASARHALRGRAGEHPAARAGDRARHRHAGADAALRTRLEADRRVRRGLPVRPPERPRAGDVLHARDAARLGARRPAAGAGRQVGGQAGAARRLGEDDGDALGAQPELRPRPLARQPLRRRSAPISRASLA